MKTGKEILDGFFKKLKQKNVKYSDMTSFLTKTQQEDCLFVGRKNTESILNGIHSLVNSCEKITIKEKPTSNKIMRDFTVDIFYGNKNVKFSCRLIKESEVRKTSEKGEWGIVLNSFKLIKK